jgi:thiol-disulfide isomerase/thioredoxin
MEKPDMQILRAPALLALALILAATARLFAAGPVIFEPNGDFLLVVDGKEQPKAETYRSTSTAQILVLSSALPSPVLLSPGTSAVVTVPVMQVVKQASGVVHMFDGAILASQGVFRLEGQNVAFSSDGHSGLLKPRPNLLKAQTATTLLDYNPAYRRNARAYQPDAAALKALQSGRKQPVKVQVYFGSWCPHCTQAVPRILRTQEMLGQAPIQFEYYGLPPFPELSKDPEAIRLGLNGVPTGVVLVDGREAGRITGAGWNNPEVVLQDILGAWARK